MLSRLAREKSFEELVKIYILKRDSVKISLEILNRLFKPRIWVVFGKFKKKFYEQ